MKAHLLPSKSTGSIHIPPSKSMSHRAIICAALAHGESIIQNVAYSKDILATIEGMKQLGASIRKDGSTLYIRGVQSFQQLAAKEIFCNESGSTLRFFIPIFSLCNQDITFTGQGRLLDRPQKVYADIFHKQGLDFTHTPSGIHIHQSLQAGGYTLKGDVSSQFISGLLFALPLLTEDSTIHIEPPFESRSYIDLTLEMMERFGVKAYYHDEYTLYIPGNQQYQACNYTIEGDYSQLAFFAVLGAISNGITLHGVTPSSKQGDKQIIDILKQFGALIDTLKDGYRIHPAKLIGQAINLENCPDLGPIVCVLGMYGEGTTHIYNASRLRIKESDRIAAMEEELRKFGTNITSTPDTITIQHNPNPICQTSLYGHNDHRIVMALSVAAMASRQEAIIEDAQAIEKSYPTFFEDFKKVGGKVDLL